MSTRCRAGFCFVFVKNTELSRLELQGKRVDAVARSFGAGPVVENMPEVGVAALAADLSANHPVAAILDQSNALQFLRMRKARPPAVRIELRVGGEKGGAASPAEIASFGIQGEQRTAKRAFRSGFAQNVITLVPKLGTPFGFATMNFGGW